MKRKYSVILGNLGNTRDRFCSSYKKNPATMGMLRRAAKIPHVTGIELVGTWDIYPVVIGRVHALEGGGTRSGWKAANRGVGQDLDASV